MFNYASVREIQNLLKSHNIAMLKRFGQNFMVHEATRKRFVQLLPRMHGPDACPGSEHSERPGRAGSEGTDQPRGHARAKRATRAGSEQSERPGQEVWEIGPGIGAITTLLLQTGMHVRVFEIDAGFIGCLEELFAGELQDGSLSIVKGDARRTLFQQSSRPAAITGNLPYNIASGLVSRLITQGFASVSMVFTFQKEVVERICARPGQRNYGSLSILCQYVMKVEHCGTISPGFFFPAPRVHSAIVRLSPLNEANADEIPFLEKLLSLLFRSRRKTIASNIQQSLTREQAGHLQETIRSTGIDTKLRAETLCIEDFRNIIAALSTDRIRSAPWFEEHP